MSLNLIVKMVFGSRLYGTATPESDLDYKSCYLPSKKEIFLNRVPKSYRHDVKVSSGTKNTSDDKDDEIYSLHYFIDLALGGQTVALDMLHAPENMLEVTSDIWKEVVANRSKFYTKNLNAFVSYAHRQASKYSLRGSRIDTIEKVLSVLKNKIK